MLRLFFHSFPRRRPGETDEAQIERGLKIAQNMLDNGLLLSPETYEIPITAPDGKLIDKFTTTQRRACFTELEPDLLAEHSETFGPFSLAYRIEDLRQLGAIPVFYVPTPASTGYLSGLATDLFRGAIDAKHLVATLFHFRNHLLQAPMLRLTYREKEVVFGPEEANTLNTFINILTEIIGSDLETTHKRLCRLASCYYAGETAQYTEQMHYYRQREWRLVAGPYTVDNELVSQPATYRQVETLLSIDREFFSKQVPFFDADQGIGSKVVDSLANHCHFIRHVGDLDVIGLARCLVVPEGVPLDSPLAAAFRKRGVPFESVEFES